MQASVWFGGSVAVATTVGWSATWVARTIAQAHGASAQVQEMFELLIAFALIALLTAGAIGAGLAVNALERFRERRTQRKMGKESTQ